MTEIRHALPQGCRLDEYEFIRVLGHGGFGVTYLARDVNLGKEVAIKEYFPTDLVVREDGFSVRPRSQSDEGDYEYGLERFLDEARTLAQFRHPNIVVVHRFFRANGTAYLIMDYEHGEQFGSILKQRRTIPEAELLDLVHPLLDGLADVHKAGILHRDIKPENIYVRENGSPVLIDFGAARQALSSRSKTLTAVLTPGYAPFEQYYSSGDQGPWTDIYAMASVMYRAVSGGDPVESVARLDADTQTPTTAAAQGRYKKHILEAIDAGLAVKPADRPQNVDEFRAMLDGKRNPKRAAAAAAAAGASASGPASAGRSRKRASGFGKIPVAATVAGVALLGASIGIAAWFASGDDGPGQIASGNSGATQASGSTAGAGGSGDGPAEGSSAAGGSGAGEEKKPGAAGTTGGAGGAKTEAERLTEILRQAEAERKRLEEERARLEEERRRLAAEKKKDASREKAAEAEAARRAAAEARQKAIDARKAEADARRKAAAAAARKPEPAAEKKPPETAARTPRTSSKPKVSASSAKIEAWCTQQRSVIIAKYEKLIPPKCAEVDRPTSAGMANESYGQTECGQQNMLHEYRTKLKAKDLADLDRRCVAMRQGEPVQ